MAMTTIDERVKIRPDVKQWWATRLTDGSIAQLREKLTAGWVGNPVGSPDEVGHPQEACCLGVLTWVAIEHGCENVRWNPLAQLSDDYQVQVWDEETASEHPEDPEAGWEDFADNDLPRAVEEWAFGNDYTAFGNPVLTTGQPPLPGESLVSDGNKAIHLNDKAQWSFEQIAAAVRDLPELEVPSDDSGS